MQFANKVYTCIQTVKDHGVVFFEQGVRYRFQDVVYGHQGDFRCNVRNETTRESFPIECVVVDDFYNLMCKSFE